MLDSDAAIATALLLNPTPQVRGTWVESGVAVNDGGWQEMEESPFEVKFSRGLVEFIGSLTILCLGLPPAALPAQGLGYQ